MSSPKGRSNVMEMKEEKSPEELEQKWKTSVGWSFTWFEKLQAVRDRMPESGSESPPKRGGPWH